MLLPVLATMTDQGVMFATTAQEEPMEVTVNHVEMDILELQLILQFVLLFSVSI